MRGCWLERGGRALGTLAALTPLACAGAQPAPLASSTPAASAGTASGYALPSAAAERAFPAQPLAEHVTESRLVRLNHRQYRNTVQDLLGGRAGFDLALPPDAHGGFIFDTDSGLLVDGRLGPQYRIAAEVL